MNPAHPVVGRRTRCPFCGDEVTWDLDADADHRWRLGDLVQDAFVQLSPDERERLLTGLCADCWASRIAIDEDEEGIR